MLRIIKSLVNRDIYVRPDYVCVTQRFGSQYVGWDVALDVLNKNTVVYSFGVGSDISFDLALINKFNLNVHAFDPTPASIKYIKEQNIPDRFMFHPYGILDIDGDVQFNPPVNPDYISHTVLNRPQTNDRAIMVPVKRLATIMKELGHQRIDILKMDIEGAEYAVLQDMIQCHIEPKQILIEFHHRFDNVGVQRTKESIEKLKKIGYSLFSVSASNEEFCFIRKN